MKKLKLNLQNIEGAEILTKAQLKNVLGGNGTITTEPITTTDVCAGVPGDVFPCYCNGEFNGCYDSIERCVDSCEG